MDKLKKKVKQITAKYCLKCGKCCSEHMKGVHIGKSTKKFAVMKGIRKFKAREAEENGITINKVKAGRKHIPMIIEVCDANPFFPLRLPDGFFISLPEKDMLFWNGEKCPFLKEVKEGVCLCSIHGKNAFPEACAIYPAIIEEKKKQITLRGNCGMLKDKKTRKKIVSELKKLGKGWKIKLENFV